MDWFSAAHGSSKEMIDDGGLLWAMDDGCFNRIFVVQIFFFNFLDFLGVYLFNVFFLFKD